MRELLYLALALALIGGIADARDAHAAPNSPAEERPQFDSPQQESARQAIQRRAAWKAAQRRQRLEAYQWMGYSPLRPPASQLQFMGADRTMGVGTVYYHFPGMLLPHYVLMPR